MGKPNLSRLGLLGSAINPALIGQCFQSKWAISTESPFREPAKMNENNKQESPLFSFLAIMTLECVHVFCPLWSIESPCPEQINHTGGRFFHSPKKTARAKACSSHRCEVSISGNLTLNFNTFLRFFEGNFSGKFLAKFERSDRFQPEKIHSTRYTKYHCLFI